MENLLHIVNMMGTNLKETKLKLVNQLHFLILIKRLSPCCYLIQVQLSYLCNLFVQKVLDYRTFHLITCLTIVYLISTWTLDITILVFPIFLKWENRKEKSCLAFDRKQTAKNFNHQEISVQPHHVA